MSELESQKNFIQKPFLVTYEPHNLLSRRGVHLAFLEREWNPGPNT